MELGPAISLVCGKLLRTLHSNLSEWTSFKFRRQRAFLERVDSELKPWIRDRHDDQTLEQEVFIFNSLGGEFEVYLPGKKFFPEFF